MLRGINRRPREGVDRRFLPAYSFNSANPRLTRAQQLTYAQTVEPSLAMRGRRRNLEAQDVPVNIDPEKRNQIKLADLINRIVPHNDNPAARVGTAMEVEDADWVEVYKKASIVEQKLYQKTQKESKALEGRIQKELAKAEKFRKQQMDLFIKYDARMKRLDVNMEQARIASTTGTPTDSSKVASSEKYYKALEEKYEELSRVLSELVQQSKAANDPGDNMARFEAALNSRLTEVVAKGEEINTTVQALSVSLQKSERDYIQFQEQTKNGFATCVKADEFELLNKRLTAEFEMADMVLRDETNKHYATLVELTHQGQENEARGKSSDLKIAEALNQYRDVLDKVAALGQNVGILSTQAEEFRFQIYQVDEKQAKLQDQVSSIGEAMVDDPDESEKDTPTRGISTRVTRLERNKEKLFKDIEILRNEFASLSDVKQVQTPVEQLAVTEGAKRNLIGEFTQVGRGIGTQNLEYIFKVLDSLQQSSITHQGIMNSFKDGLNTLEEKFGTTMRDVADLKTAADQKQTDAQIILGDVRKEFADEVQRLSAETRKQLNAMNVASAAEARELYARTQTELSNRNTRQIQEALRNVNVQLQQALTEAKLVNEQTVEAVVAKQVAFEESLLSNSQIISRVLHLVEEVDARLGRIKNVGLDYFNQLRADFAANTAAMNLKLRTVYSALKFQLTLEDIRAKRQNYAELSHSIRQGLAEFSSSMSVSEFIEFHRNTLKGTISGIQSMTGYAQYTAARQRIPESVVNALTMFIEKYSNQTATVEQQFNASILSSFDEMMRNQMTMITHFDDYLNVQFNWQANTMAQMSAASVTGNPDAYLTAIDVMAGVPTSVTTDVTDSKNVPPAGDIKAATQDYDSADEEEDMNTLFEDILQTPRPRRTPRTPQTKEEGRGFRQTNPALKRKRYQPIYSIRN